MGKYKDDDISVAKGRFGPYIKWKGVFASLPKAEDPFTVTLETAIQLIMAKEKKDAEKLIKFWEENNAVKVVVGRYGPCIQAGKKFFRIPADKQPQELTLEECLEIAGLTKKTICKIEKSRS